MVLSHPQSSLMRFWFACLVFVSYIHAVMDLNLFDVFSSSWYLYWLMCMLFHFDGWQLILVGSCVLRHFLSRLRCILEKQDDPYLAHVTFPAPNWESAILPRSSGSFGEKWHLGSLGTRDTNCFWVGRG